MGSNATGRPPPPTPALRNISMAPHFTQEELYNGMLGDDGWALKKPSLLISVTGGAKSFGISPRLKKDFVEGLRKV